MKPEEVRNLKKQLEDKSTDLKIATKSDNPIADFTNEVTKLILTTIMAAKTDLSARNILYWDVTKWFDIKGGSSLGDYFKGYKSSNKISHYNITNSELEIKLGYLWGESPNICQNIRIEEARRILKSYNVSISRDERNLKIHYHYDDQNEKPSIIDNFFKEYLEKRKKILLSINKNPSLIDEVIDEWVHIIHNRLLNIINVVNQSIEQHPASLENYYYRMGLDYQLYKVYNSSFGLDYPDNIAKFLCNCEVDKRHIRYSITENGLIYSVEIPEKLIVTNAQLLLERINKKLEKYGIKVSTSNKNDNIKKIIISYQYSKENNSDIDLSFRSFIDKVTTEMQTNPELVKKEKERDLFAKTIVNVINDIIDINCGNLKGKNVKEVLDDVERNKALGNYIIEREEPCPTFVNYKGVRTINEGYGPSYSYDKKNGIITINFRYNVSNTIIMRELIDYNLKCLMERLGIEITFREESTVREGLYGSYLFIEYHVPQYDKIVDSKLLLSLKK